MPLNTRRFRLRESTSHAHASLDRLIGQFRSVADYERYALGLFAFRIPLEEKLATIDWPDAFAEWRPQLIGHALRADLYGFVGLNDREHGCEHDSAVGAAADTTPGAETAADRATDHQCASLSQASTPFRPRLCR